MSITRSVLACTLFLTALELPSPAIAGPVQDAALAGDTAKLAQLLEGGAEADEKGVGSPLYFATQRGHIDAAALLIEHGANVNLPSPWGAPLHIAAKRGRLDLIELLLKSGADPNLVSGENGFTPLHEAAVGGQVEAAAVLLDHGADVNARATGRVRGPAIHLAVYNGKMEVAELLRARGAAPEPVEPIGADLAGADLELGKARATACTPCHTYTPGDPGERGPSLWNIVGRVKASEPDFPYTDAMAAQTGVWDYEELNRFLADVQGTVPGTDMYTGSEPDRATRTALIAYLRTMADNPVPLP